LWCFQAILQMGRVSSCSTCSSADGVQFLPELPILLLQHGDLQLQVLLLMTEK